VVRMEDRHLNKRKNKWLIFTETALLNDEYLLEFDTDGNFYDEQKSLLNPPPTSKKKNKTTADQKDQIKWDSKNDDELLKLIVKHTNSARIVVNVMGYSEHTIEVRLYQLIGRPYNGMPQETKSERILAETRRSRWKMKKKIIKAQIDKEFYAKKDEKRRKQRTTKRRPTAFTE